MLMKNNLGDYRRKMAEQLKKANSKIFFEFILIEINFSIESLLYPILQI